MMSSSNKDGNNHGVYPLSLYLSSLPGHQDIIRNPYNQQLTASPGKMVSAVPESLIDYMAFNSNDAVNQRQGFELPEVSREIKKAVKKDRHSKIHTAQGLRDRRVRLSIGVARQFFDLQDMLGFDKASKTLDWLLKKSRKAIKEVVQEKKLNNGNENFGDNGGDVEEEVEEEEEEDGDNSLVYGSSPESCGEKVVCEVKKADKRKKNNEYLCSISSNGSRDNAKGKAKERSRKMAYDNPETVSDITLSETLDSFIFSNEGKDMTHFFYKETIGEFGNQDPISTKMKVNMPTNMDQSYNQDTGAFMLIDQGSSSNYSTIDLPLLDYNYEQNPFVDQTFCAVTDTSFPGGLP